MTNVELFVIHSNTWNHLILLTYVYKSSSLAKWVEGSIPGRVIPKTLKIVLDTSLLSTQ